MSRELKDRVYRMFSGAIHLPDVELMSDNSCRSYKLLLNQIKLCDRIDSRNVGVCICGKS